MHKPAGNRDDRSLGAVDADLTRPVPGGIGGGDRFAVGAQRRDLGKPRWFQLVEAQRGAVDDVFPVEQADHHGVGNAGFQWQILCPGRVQCADLRTVPEVDGHHGRVRGHR